MPCRRQGGGGGPKTPARQRGGAGAGIAGRADVADDPFHLKELNHLSLLLSNDHDAWSLCSSKKARSASSKKGHRADAERKTDGRACRLCGRKDWDPDPGVLIVKKIEVLMY